MTNSFKYTPGRIDAKSSGALLGNFGKASFLERASGGGKPWSRAEAIRSAKEARPEVIKSYPSRVANVRRVPSIGGFHVIGLGQVPQITLKELQTKLGANGYNAYRVGGLVFKLFKKS